MITTNTPNMESVVGRMDARDEIREFVGPNAGYYLHRWRPLLDSGRGLAGFNWAAAFLSIFWIGYRKMYGIAAIVFGVLIVESVLEHFYFIGYLGMPEPPGFLNPLVTFAVGLVCGIFGNQWYFRHATKRILNVRRQESELEVRRTKLAKLGGTNWPGMILVILIILIATFVAILFTAFILEIA